MDDLGGFGRRSVVMMVGEEGASTAAAEAGEFVPAAEKYDVEGRIGAGGMGEVLLVADRDLRRQIAMKVIRPAMASEKEHRVKFVAEAQATSQLEYPGIPPVHDIGVTPAGRVWFTMKLVRGRTLSEVLKDLLLGRRFPWGDLDDPTLGKCRDSRDEDSQPEPVGTFPTARSVYGMGDAAGNVWDWTDSWFDERGSLRVLRGGSWFSESSSLRCALRDQRGPRFRSTLVGFRCARGFA